jgi:hypothetical protein
MATTTTNNTVLLSTQTITVIGGGLVGSTLATAMVDTLGDLRNKVLIDATNPFSSFPDGLQARWEQGTRGGEYIQSLLPNTKVYKAFNTLGVLIASLVWQHGTAKINTSPAATAVAISCTSKVDFPMATNFAFVLTSSRAAITTLSTFPDLDIVEHMADGTGKDMLFAGPDAAIANVIAMIGYNPIYVGPIRYARNLEAMAELWTNCAISQLPANYLGLDWTFKLAGQYNE